MIADVDDEMIAAHAEHVDPRRRHQAVEIHVLAPHGEDWVRINVVGPASPALRSRVRF